ncbi:hypothetical protein H8959_014416 [Pygathrix nigripes]
MAGENHTTLPEFLLLGFSDHKALQGPLFWVVLLVYLVTLLGNSLIILLTQVSPALHSPMYFFLRQLSVVELFYTTNIVPRTLANLASPHPQAISFQGCAAQIHPIIPHFLCDILPVLRLASAGKHRSEISVMTATVVFIMIPFSLIVTSYIRILGAILAMASTQSRRKVFSTCSSHLLVVSLFFGTASITYIRPQAGSSVTTDRVLSLFYTVVTPMLNPIIYTLRNKDVRRALQHLVKRQSPLP